MNWRGLIALGWVLLLLVVLAGFAWMTQNPDAEILETATEWPLIGPLAERFRERYLGPETQGPDATAEEPPAEGLVVIQVLPRGDLDDDQPKHGLPGCPQVRMLFHRSDHVLFRPWHLL